LGQPIFRNIGAISNNAIHRFLPLLDRSTDPRVRLDSLGAIWYNSSGTFG